MLHQDDGLVPTRVTGEKLADLELRVVRRFLSNPGRVLDVGCGRGRACNYFTTLGFDAVGVELDFRTLRDAEGRRNGSSEFILADGRELCFRDYGFDYVVSFASTLSEKHRLWMSRDDRRSFVREAVRVTRPNGLILFSFVHRYWNIAGFFRFFRHYWMWLTEKMSRKRTEVGDYVEKFGRARIRFHAFTIREAKSLFPLGEVRLEVWRRDGGPFTDWFFIIARKTR